MSVLSRRGPRRKPRSPQKSDEKRSYKAAPDRRRQILDCALAAFAEKGYHAASIADVCGRAGIGRATLYQYFQDKRDLLAALAEDIAARVVEACENRPPLDVPPGFKPTEEQAVRFIEGRIVTVLSVVLENADTARLVLRAGRGADGVVDEMLRRVDRAVLERFEAELTLAKDAGVIRPVDVAFVARFFLGGVEKTVLSYLEENRPWDVRRIAKEAALLEVLGIFARPNSHEAPGATEP
ncbi:MAG: TetR/AcrR family transcriptional regulator [Myxococcales bacterium]|nr:TetR/AcrR family transcriptional regulator [Myxococcales bacterium]